MAVLLNIRAKIADCQNNLPYYARGFATEYEHAIKALVELDEQLFQSQTRQLGFSQAKSDKMACGAT